MRNDGKAFETSVRELLRLSGYSVKPEILIGHKRVDAIAEERRFNEIHRIAVECKQHGRVLTQEQVTQIIAAYRPLYDDNRVDEVLLVTDKGISASAVSLVRSSRFLRHITLVELQSQIIDFSGYLQALHDQVRDDGLDSYYVRLRSSDGSDLETFFDRWLDASSKPLAILGSYGMGKTSFVRYKAAALAHQALHDVSARIPIVVHLSEISAEQSLAGLLGRVLASSGVVRHYNFEIFAALNAAGRFVIFLDGFDEMKHTLTWDQFRFNFSELNRLVSGDSRVVLLGRPTAFLSDSEHDHALHGRQWLGQHSIRIPGWPDYEEVHLAPFTPDQVRTFLIHYTQYLATVLPSVAASADDIMERIEKLSPGRLSDLATRPVQLRILAEVLPQWGGTFEDLTAAKLYGSFIDLVIMREQEKLPSRSRFSSAERRIFAGALAYWLWTEKASLRSVTGADIPHSLFPVPKGDDTSEGVRRDMVAACFLDRKKGDALYFPHRSFQEFLVAEELSQRAARDNLSVKHAAEISTPEVLDFLTELVDLTACTGFDRAVRMYRGTLPSAFLRSWLGCPSYREDLLRQLGSDSHAWLPVLLTLSIMTDSSMPAERVARAFVEESTKFRYPAERMLRIVSAIQIAGTLEPALADVIVWEAMISLQDVIRNESSVQFAAERRFLERAIVIDDSYSLDAAIAHICADLRVFALTSELASPNGPYEFRTSFRLPVAAEGRSSLQQMLVRPDI